MLGRFLLILCRLFYVIIRKAFNSRKFVIVIRRNILFLEILRRILIHLCKLLLFLLLLETLLILEKWLLLLVEESLILLLLEVLGILLMIL